MKPINRLQGLVTRVIAQLSGDATVEPDNPTVPLTGSTTLVKM